MPFVPVSDNVLSDTIGSDVPIVNIILSDMISIHRLWE